MTPRVTLAGTALWSIQKENQEILLKYSLLFSRSYYLLYTQETFSLSVFLNNYYHVFNHPEGEPGDKDNHGGGHVDGQDEEGELPGEQVLVRSY